MKLDFNTANGKFLWHGTARGPDRKVVADRAGEIGLDFSTSASSGDRLVYFTESPYAALPLLDANSGSSARERLAFLKRRLDMSWREDWTGSRFSMPDDVELHPYQSAGVDYVLKTGHAVIGDMPGLGKTMQALVVANEMRAKRVLVVCPAAVRLQWRDQIKVWAVGDTRGAVIETAKQGVDPDIRWTVISYDLAKSTLRASLVRGKWDLVILDEVHYLKSPEAKRTQALFGWTENINRERVHMPGIAEKAERIVGLTGTFLPNRPAECYTTTRALAHEAIDYFSLDAFRARFNPQANFRTGARERAGRLPELYTRLRTNLMVRRRREDVLTQLPPITYTVVHVENTGAVRQALEHERMLDIDPDTFKQVSIDGEVSTVRREMGIAKAPHVVNFVKNALDGGEQKLVLFGHHREVLDVWQEKLHGYDLVRIDGSTSLRARAEACRRFIEDPNCRVIIGNLMSMGTGVDGLQHAASLAVFGENSWVPGENEQGVFRLGRIGQENPVQAVFMVAEGSIDERVVSSAQRKAVTTYAALDGG